MRLCVNLALVLLCVACASPPPATAPGPPWQAPLGHDHPLIGSIWSIADGVRISPGDLLDRLVDKQFVLLGEKHDNPDHHRIQAWILGALMARGSTVAVAFEMLTPDQRGAMDRARAERPQDPDHLAEAVDWASSGWPSFKEYRPIFATALAFRLEIVPANLTLEEVQKLSAQEKAVLSPTFIHRFALDTPLPSVEYKRRAEEIRVAHCGYVSGEMIGTMVEIQRARDARMAESLMGPVSAPLKLLISGKGHARNDGGVPVYLRRKFPAQSIVSLGLTEVRSGLDDPLAYEEGSFDFMWFTPRLEDVDACDKFRPQLEKLAPAGPDVVE